MKCKNEGSHILFLQPGGGNFVLEQIPFHGREG